MRRECRKEVGNMMACVCGFAAETEGELESHIGCHLLSYGLAPGCRQADGGEKREGNEEGRGGELSGLL